jgi:hypothetical protein
VLILAKLARAAELGLRVGSPWPFWLVPASFGQDLVLIASVGLLAYGLGKLRSPALRITLTWLVLVPIGLLLPADVLSYMLTGRPLTIQRLRGGEGATFADTNLLAPADFAGACAGMLFAVLLIWPCLHFGPRIRWLRLLSRPKPLLALLLLGCGVGALQVAFLPRTQGLSEQPVFALLGSFFDEAGLQALAIEPAEWRALHAPGIPLPPPPPAPARRTRIPKNVVIFLGEGIPFKATGFDPRFAGSHDPTPNLTRRWGEHGVMFDHYHANWHASIQAIFSIVCSAYPPMSGDIVRVKPRIDCGELSEVMRERDVVPGLFHSGQFNFYNKLALLGRRGYATELDAAELAKTSRRETQQWGIDDRAMVDATLQWVDTLPRSQRFAALMIAVSPHYPYWLPRDYKGPFPKDSREHVFLNGVTFVDSVFEQLLRGFEERGLYDDTLFVWLGDHGHYVGEPERETPGLRQFYEPNLHTPLVLLSSAMFPPELPRAARVNARPGSHIDLLPTILDALALPAEARHQGQSLLGDVFEPRRVFFGATDGKYVGFYEGPYKFVQRTRRAGVEYYDLSRDPQELEDISGRFPDRMKRYGQQAMRFAQGVEAAIAAAPVLPERISVDRIYDLYLQHVAVTLRAGGQTAPCSPGPDVRCPELGVVMQVRNANIQGDARRCVLVKVPPRGSIELSIEDPDTLDLMSGTIVALPAHKGRGKLTIDIAVGIDGQAQQGLTLTAREAVRLQHARARRQLRIGFGQRARDATLPAEVCLQLTALLAH